MTPAQYLLNMGLEVIEPKSKFATRFGDKDNRVEIGPNWITVECYKDEEDDIYGSWHQQYHINYKILTLDQFISFMDMTGVVPYTVMLAKLADESGMTDKRALYHIREAVKRTA